MCIFVMEIAPKSPGSSEKSLRRQVSHVDYKAMDDGVQVVEETITSPKPKIKKQIRRRRHKEDPDYNPVTPSVKKNIPGFSEGNHSKRQRQPVDYMALDGGSESDDSSEVKTVKLKRVRQGTGKSNGSKRPRVEVSLGVPPEGNEVVRQGAINSEQAAVRTPQRRLVIVRVPPGGSPAPNCRVAGPGTLLRPTQAAPLHFAGEGAQRPMVLVPVSTKGAVGRHPDPYELDDLLFNKEVNKFLAASMTNELACEPSARAKAAAPQKLPERIVLPAGSPPRPPAGLSAPGNLESPQKARSSSSAARSLIRSSEAAPPEAAAPGPASPVCSPQELSDEVVPCPMCGSRLRGKQMKKHALVCKGVLVAWSENGYLCAAQSASIDRAALRFGCPRCETVLHSDEEFQVHVATEHGFFWRLDFGSEEEYRRWCLVEGFDETMISGQSKRLPDVEERSFYCAMNSARKGGELKCPCRMVVKKKAEEVSVRYFPAHNHCERVVKRAMTRECRDLVVRLVRAGKSNATILAEVRHAYPENSRNHHISKELVSSIRYKLRQAGELRRRGRPRIEAQEVEEAEELETIT